MAPANLIVIIGGSGTGKTTLARALQERLLPAQLFHFSPDTFLYCLPKSIVDRADFANDWSVIDVKLISELAYRCARSALGAGRRVVFDCVVMSERGARRLLTAFAQNEPFLVRTTCTGTNWFAARTCVGTARLKKCAADLRAAASSLRRTACSTPPPVLPRLWPTSC
jgi:predicted kinase